MNDLNPSEQRLAEQLRRQAQSVDIADTPLASVIQRGRQRTDRRRVAVGVAAVIALSATVIGTIQLLSRPVSHRVTPATDSKPADDATPSATLPADTTGEQLTPVNRIESNLVWNTVEPASGEALGSIIWDNSSLTGQKAPYLAWSSSPGKSANQEFIYTLYQSDDGIHWVPAGGQSFTQPEVSVRGVGSRNGRMFAFGTAAATAPIPSGGGGEVVVDVSDDQGASWKDITLPFDLRGLASSKGVQSVGFQGDMVTSDAGVVALGVPLVNVDLSAHPGLNAGYIPRRDGAIPVTFPDCSSGAGPTTISVQGGFAPAPTTAPDDTIPADFSTTTTYPAADTAPAGQCQPATPEQSALIPWADLGVDGAAVAEMFTPRVFLSTDGETFVEGSFPALPDDYQMNQVDVTATAAGFAASAHLYDASGGGGIAKLYFSADGLTWTESDMPTGFYNSISILDDGTIVAFGNDLTGVSFTAVSSDGIEWSKLTLSSLLNPDDGKTALLTVVLAAAGPGGITAVANIDVDKAAETGGVSIEKDGVRLTIHSARFQTLVATDIATGETIGQFDPNNGPADPKITRDDRGGYRVLNDDSTVRVAFSDADVQVLFQDGYTVKPVMLHSADGINWSREDIKPLVGFDTFGATRVQVTDTNVLVSFVNPNARDAVGIPRTTVLVGTEKS